MAAEEGLRSPEEAEKEEACEGEGGAESREERRPPDAVGVAAGEVPGTASEG